MPTTAMIAIETTVRNFEAAFIFSLLSQPRCALDGSRFGLFQFLDLVEPVMIHETIHECHSSLLPYRMLFRIGYQPEIESQACLDTDAP